MFLKYTLYTILFSLFAWGLNLDDLFKMPKSVERDFYIWQFLKTPSTTKREAIEAASLINAVNNKLESAFFKKTGSNLPKRVTKLSLADKKKYQLLLHQMHQTKSFYQAWLSLSDKEKLKLFALAGRANRALLNSTLDLKLYNRLTKYAAINEFIFRAKAEHLEKIYTTILAAPPVRKNRINYNNLLQLGFENLKRGEEALASRFFYSAVLKAKSRYYADKALFWLYQASKQKKYLQKLAASYDFNIYKFVALDLLQKPYPRPATEKIDTNATSPIDITNPIAWAKLKKKIFTKNSDLYALAKKYNSSVSAAYYYYILNKASKDKKQYFPILYKDILTRYPIEREAMLLALARQESHFIPASVSRSFALGMMQFMPFLIRHISKKRGEPMPLEAIFNPKVSLKFANTHLDYLEKYLHHPLFVAYAYNAGIGYTRRMLQKNIFKPGKYEPYLSLEMVDNKQANHYGKKVLANYIVYRMLLGKPIKATTLLNQISTTR